MHLGCNMKIVAFFLYVLESHFMVFGGICICGGLYVLLGCDKVIDDIGLNFNDARDNIDNMTKTMNKYPGSKIYSPPNTTDSSPLHDTTFKDLVKGIGIVFIVTGGLMAITGVVTIISSFKDLRKLTVTCIVITILWTCLELAACLIIIKFREPADYFLRRHFKHQIDTEFIGYKSHDRVSMGWNLLMQKFHCCGVDNYLDFKSSRSFNDTWFQPLHSIPDPMLFETAIACCDNIEIVSRLQDRFLLPCHKEAYINKKGCLSVFWEGVDKHVVEVATSFIVAIIAQVVMVIVICCYRLKRQNSVTSETKKDASSPNVSTVQRKRYNSNMTLSDIDYNMDEKWYNGNRELPTRKPKLAF